MAGIEDPVDISIPLRFNGPQPNAFGVEPARASACEYGDLVGDTRRGGSCNFEQIVLIPHCNGTHTECVGHITNDRISIRDCLQDILFPARLISVEPESAVSSGERYAVPFNIGDVVITRRAIELKASSEKCESLVIRTLPNDDSKLTRVYSESTVPYFTNEAMEFIVSLGVRHLLVDVASVDRMEDEGKLSNHRIFWDVDLGSRQLRSTSRIRCTITELIYVPESTADGDYMLNLQIAPFDSDASPSRPILIKMKNS